MKYLFIDSNNLCCRHAFAHPEMNSNKVPTAIHYGFFTTLANLRQKFPSHNILIVWDGKSKRRMAESQEAVKNCIVPEAYKENRKKDEMPQPLKDFYAQSPFLQRGIGQTGFPQIRLPDFEADDVIASYVKLLKGNSEDIVCVTSDSDYFQVLDDNVRIWNGQKMSEVTIDTFKNEWGIDSKQYVDVGALMGDDGDNIFGVPGWGEKTALKEIKKYGSWSKVLQVYHSLNLKNREKYPDLNTLPDGEQKFKYLSEKKSPKGKFIYPEIIFNMPYTGVLLAFDQELISCPKTEIMALMFEERIKLAYSLKKMDDDIPELPLFEKGPLNRKNMEEYMDYYDIKTLQEAIDLFE